MNYQFSRKRLAALAACLALLVVISFSAGLVAGIGLGMPAREELASLKHKGAARKEATRVEAPPPLSATSDTAEVEARSKPLDATAAPEAPAAPDVAPVAPSAGMPASELPAEASVDDLFSLQVGSFRDAGNAKQLQADLKDRGYDARVITALDAEQREWHVVRMGSYKTLESAARAAATFNDKERMSALVRHANAL